MASGTFKGLGFSLTIRFLGFIHKLRSSAPVRSKSDKHACGSSQSLSHIAQKQETQAEAPVFPIVG